ncbi:glutathione S-transferase family protein [Ensifer soli]|uniref:glutathione S-transferase family protein n=1 Tax=Ciceribacter sp. sgz301302 TaxID=3342379 RepID=UPI0035B99AA8
MPQLVDGKWEKGDVAASEMKNGAFHREPTVFRRWITADGGPGPDGQPAVKAEPGRYRLFVSYLCPWASRTIAMRSLKGLDGIVGLSVSEPELGENGWEYAEPQFAGARVGAIRYQHELYTASEPHYTGKVSVPVLWDMREGVIVNNESADIIRILNGAFDGIGGNRLDFYPADLKDVIDHWNAPIYETVNNGVYRAGFAKTQAAYEEAVTRLFKTLDMLDAHLGENRYLAGTRLTEADLRLFVTLIRFDAAYHGAFKCNIRRIEDYAHLPGYLREIYQWPGIRASVRIDHIKRGYYGIRHINPTGIVPLGPLVDYDTPHGRGALAGEGVTVRP